MSPSLDVSIWLRVSAISSAREWPDVSNLFFSPLKRVVAHVSAMADATVKRFIRKRGYRRPEDRLKGAILGVGLILPLSGITYGWVVQYG